MHGGGPPVTAGTPLAPEYKEENVGLIEKGVCNLVKHIQNTAQYGVPVIVAINKFASDTDAEMEIIRTKALKAGLSFIPCSCLLLNKHDLRMYRVKIRIFGFAMTERREKVQQRLLINEMSLSHLGHHIKEIGWEFAGTYEWQLTCTSFALKPPSMQELPMLSCVSTMH